MKQIILIILISVFALNLMAADKEIFVEVDTVKVNLDDILHSGISDVEQLPDGFLFLLYRGRKNNLLVKVDKKGNVVKVYDKPGNGPGELRHIFNIVVYRNSIYAIEGESPYMHEYTHDLKFKKDYRINAWGRLYILGKYAGIWRPNTFDEKSEEIYTLALHDPNDFTFKRHVFRVKEVPAFFTFWGDVCMIDENNIAGVYSTEYQIRIFDGDMNFKKNLLEDTPNHIKKYSPYKGSKNVVGQNAYEWTKTWSVISKLYYVDKMFLLSYTLNKEFFLDIIDMNGKILYPNYKEKKKFGIVFIEDQKYVWRLKVEEGDESDKYSLVKQKLVL